MHRLHKIQLEDTPLPTATASAHISSIIKVITAARLLFVFMLLGSTTAFTKRPQDNDDDEDRSQVRVLACTALITARFFLRLGFKSPETIDR